MKKTSFVSVSFCFALLLIFAASCTESNDYRRAVPENALLVGKADLAQLSENANLKDSGILSIIRGMASLGGSEILSDFDQFVADPSSTGIDFDNPAYLFFTPDSCVGMVMSVANEANLETTLGKLQDLGLISEIEKEDGVKMTDIDRTTVLAYDESCLLLCYSDNISAAAKLRSKAIEWMGQAKEEQFLAQHDDFAENTAPVTLFLSGDFYEMMDDAYKTTAAIVGVKMLLPQGVALSDLDFLCALSFEENEAVLRAKATGKNEEAQKALEEYAEVFKEIDGDFLEYCSDEDLVVALNCKGKKLAAYLKQFPKIEAAIEEIAEEGFDVTQALDLIDGDVMVTISDLTANSPAFGVFVKVKDTNTIRALIDMVTALGMNIVSKGNDEYVFYDDFTPYYIKVGNDHVIVSAQELSDSKKESRIRKSDVAGSVFYLSLSGGGLEAPSNGFLKKIEARGTSHGEVEWRIMADEEEEQFLEGLLNAYLWSLMSSN